MAEDVPKFRLEHSTNDMAGCQQAACKRDGVKISKGELRLGIYQYFEPGDKWITLWRHWACIVPSQIKKIKELAEDDPTKVSGYASISPEAQEQVRCAFEEGKIVDRDFKDIRTDLIQKGGTGYAGDITNATGYKVEVTTRGSAMCREQSCKDTGVKIQKGELRLGIATMFDADHETWCYKHWKCISAYDLNAVRERHEQEPLDGFDKLPEQFKTVIIESFQQNEVIEPPTIADQPKPKKPKKRKAPAEKDEGEEVLAPKPKRGKKNRAAADTDSNNELGVSAPKKKRGRAVEKSPSPSPDPEEAKPKPKRVEEVDPTVARIQAMTDNLRAQAATSKKK